MSPFKTGDVVRLKSGGPKMTVTSSKDDYVWTAWFDGTDTKHGHFPAASVEIPPAKGVSMIAVARA